MHSRTHHVPATHGRLIPQRSLDRAVFGGGASDPLRRTALCLRAKARDRLKRYDEAWESAAGALKRTVRTLSYDQVNRPLYASSVNPWQKYEKFLRGVEWPGY